MEIRIYLNAFRYKNNKYVSYMLEYKNYSKIFYTTVIAETMTETTLLGLENALSKIHGAEKQSVTIITNLNYVNKAIKYKWYNNWYDNGWSTKEGKTVKHWGTWLKVRDKLVQFQDVQAEIYDKLPVELRFCNYQVTGVWR